MSNEERKRKVTVKELTFWKVNFEHGDYEALAIKNDSHWQKYSKAVAERMATPTTIAQMNKFFASKKATA